MKRRACGQVRETKVFTIAEDTTTTIKKKRQMSQITSCEGDCRRYVVQMYRSSLGDRYDIAEGEFR